MRRALLASLAAALATACATGGTAEAGRRGFTQKGIASWYGPGFDGKLTANGEVYDMNALTAAHKKLPFNTRVVVTNRDNGKKVQVRINDRGPFVRGRVIDLSRAAAERIEMLGPGTARVTLRVVRQSTKAERRYRSGHTADARQQPASFRVQLGAFREGHRAERLWEDARRVRKRLRVRLAGDVFLVELGPFKSRKTADRARRDFRKAGFEAVVLSD